MILIKGKTYDVLKFFALTVLPAVATLYFALAGIWGLPSADQVVGTIMAVDTFLGVLLQLSSNAYNNATVEGTMNIIEDPESGKQTASLELDDNPEEALDGAQRAVFKVKKTVDHRKSPK